MTVPVSVCDAPDPVCDGPVSVCDGPDPVCDGPDPISDGPHPTLQKKTVTWKDCLHKWTAGLRDTFLEAKLLHERVSTSHTQ